MALDQNYEKEYDPKGLDTYNYNYDSNSFLGWRMWQAKFIELLWFSAGADKQLLSKCPHSERVKYMGLGGVVLATALLAFSSGSYAFFTVFGPKVGHVFDVAQQKLNIFNSFAYLIGFLVSIIAGFLWAMVIFNLDRFIVTSTGHGDGTEKITKQEFKNGLPRIILAIVVAICVAKPLEIRIFKNELDGEVQIRQQQKEIELQQNSQNEYNKVYSEIQNRITQLTEENQKKEAEISDLRTRAVTEAGGIRDKNTNSTGVYGAGKVYQALDSQLKEVQERYTPVINRNKQEIESLNTRLKDAESERKSSLKKAKDQSSVIDGLALRIKLSHEKFPLESFFLTLMLIFIEITPVFIKMQFIIGPYDYLIENQKQIVMAKYGIQEKYQTITDESGKPHQELVPIYHVAESITDYEVGKLNVEKSLVKTAHKIFQEKISNEIITKPEKFMPDLKENKKEKKSAKK